MTLLIGLGNFFFRHRNALFPVFIISALLFARPQYPYGSEALDVVLDLAGVLVALCGQVLRALSVGYDYIVRGGRKKRVYADRLVQGGMFGVCRNPLYVGNFLIFLGLALILNAPLLYWLGIPLVMLVYASIITAEEQFLRARFGPEYEAYCRRVNRLWPRWRAFRPSVEGMAFDWKRLVGKEHSTTFGWILGAIAMELWSGFFIGGSGYFRQAETLLLIALFVIVALVYAVVHHYKKTGAFSSA